MGEKRGNLKEGISRLRQVFFDEDHETRTEKHFADITRVQPESDSTCFSGGW